MFSSIIDLCPRGSTSTAICENQRESTGTASVPQESEWPSAENSFLRHFCLIRVSSGFIPVKSKGSETNPTTVWGLFQKAREGLSRGRECVNLLTLHGIRTREKMEMIIFIDAEKAFDKIPHPLIKNSQ